MSIQWWIVFDEILNVVRLHKCDGQIALGQNFSGSLTVCVIVSIGDNSEMRYFVNECASPGVRTGRRRRPKLIAQVYSIVLIRDNVSMSRDRVHMQDLYE